MIMCHEPMSPGLQCNAPLSGGLSFATSLSANWTHSEYVFRCLNVSNPTHTVGNTTFNLANEDPHLFVDARGSLHVLTHNQARWSNSVLCMHLSSYACCFSPGQNAFPPRSLQSPGYQNTSWYGGDVRGDGGHFFSADGGETWTFAWHAVYSGLVNFTDGSAMRYKRERPKLVQDGSRRLVALTNGVGVALVDAFGPGADAACTLVVALNNSASN
jgi:hypothetical protein